MWIRFDRWKCLAVGVAWVLSCANLNAPEAPLPPACVEDEGSLDAVGVPRSRVEAKYPRAALRNRSDGYVCLNFTVQADGSVSDMCISDAQPQGVFDRVSVEALQQWKYAPSKAPFRSGTCFMFNAE